MAYRSFKRVLGETNLERKCRNLFGACLFVLIFCAFMGVDRVAEGLLRENTRSRASKLLSITLSKEHFLNLPEYAEMYQGIISQLQLPDSNYDIITFDPQSLLTEETKLHDVNAKAPADEEEQEIVSDLQREMLERLAKKSDELEKAKAAKAPADPAASVDVAAGSPVTSGQTPKANPAGFDKTALISSLLGEPRLFRERFSGNDYIYYEPISFKFECRHCHSLPTPMAGMTSDGLGATTGLKDEASSAFFPRPDSELAPYPYVVKIMLPRGELTTATNKARAILITVAILTAFLAWVGLYWIVKYVIVKPLNHLRDVTENVSRGDTELRAEIYTGDEFEDLASSFNRMLRHLIDTQNALQTTNDELDGRVDDLARANMQLYETNQIKNEFLANMSHELRTPLNSIIGFSEVLQNIDSLNEKQKRYVSNIRGSGHVLLQMINEILDLAKLEAGMMEVRPSEFDVRRVVDAHCEMVRPLSEEKTIDLQIHCQDNLPPIFQDQTKLQQILSNLLSNAIKFTPQGGRISVNVERNTQGELRMVVEDTGVGIAAQDREIIFEKFRQAVATQGKDNLTREFSGTGLGLSIVKELCHLLGGSIAVESEVGKGSAFTVTLPWVCAPRTVSKTEFDTRFDELVRMRRLTGTPAVQTTAENSIGGTATADLNGKDAVSTKGIASNPSDVFQPTPSSP
jgi:two-component system, NarL family, sensor histidine kinase BarA